VYLISGIYVEHVKSLIFHWILLKRNVLDEQNYITNLE